MKTGQTGKFYTATIFLFLILSSVLVMAFKVEGEFADLYSILYAQASLFIALTVNVAVLAFSRKKQGLKPLYFPFLAKEKGKYDIFAYLLMLPLSFMIVFGFNDLNEVVLHLFSKIGITGSAISVFWTTPGYLVIALVLIALTPAIIEETFIRGYCLDGLGGMKNFQAILISALLFSVMHMNPAQTVYQFMLGIILAVIVKISGNITYSMLLHFCNNAIVLLTTYFSDDYSNPTIDAKFTLQALGYALAGVIGVFAVLSLFAYIFRRKESSETTLRWFKGLMVKEGDDITAATKAEKITFWLFFAVVAVVWLLNTILM